MPGSKLSLVRGFHFGWRDVAAVLVEAADRLGQGIVERRTDRPDDGCISTAAVGSPLDEGSQFGGGVEWYLQGSSLGTKHLVWAKWMPWPMATASLEIIPPPNRAIRARESALCGCSQVLNLSFNCLT